MTMMMTMMFFANSSRTIATATASETSNPRRTYVPGSIVYSRGSFIGIDVATAAAAAAAAAARKGCS